LSKQAGISRSGLLDDAPGDVRDHLRRLEANWRLFTIGLVDEAVLNEELEPGLDSKQFARENFGESIAVTTCRVGSCMIAKQNDELMRRSALSLPADYLDIYNPVTKAVMSTAEQCSSATA